MNKKGYFVPFLVVMTLVAVGYIFFLNYDEERENTTLVIGELQIDSFDLINDAERDLINLDGMVKYSSLIALQKLGEENGVWSEDPSEDMKTKFKEIFEEEFSSFLGLSKFNNINYNYFYTFDERVVVKGIAKDLYVRERKPLEYRIEPDFEVDVDFSFDSFSELYDDYDGSKNCPPDNELFGESMVKCAIDQEFLNFEVETKDLGLVKPIIKFRIAKPVGIEFTS